MRNYLEALSKRSLPEASRSSKRAGVTRQVESFLILTAALPAAATIFALNGTIKGSNAKGPAEDNRTTEERALDRAMEKYMKGGSHGPEKDAARIRKQTARDSAARNRRKEAAKRPGATDTKKVTSLKDRRAQQAAQKEPRTSSGRAQAAGPRAQGERPEAKQPSRVVMPRGRSGRAAVPKSRKTAETPEKVGKRDPGAPKPPEIGK
jgi:hypothetical protein